MRLLLASIKTFENDHPEHLYCGVKILNFQTVMAFCGTDWFAKKKWFSLPAEIYGNVIVGKQDYDFTLPEKKHKPDSVMGSGNVTTIGNVICSATRYLENMNDQRFNNLHQYSVLDFPIIGYRNDNHFSLAIVVNPKQLYSCASSNNSTIATNEENCNDDEEQACIFYLDYLETNIESNLHHRYRVQETLCQFFTRYGAQNFLLNKEVRHITKQELPIYQIEVH